MADKFVGYKVNLDNHQRSVTLTAESGNAVTHVVAAGKNEFIFTDAKGNSCPLKPVPEALARLFAAMEAELPAMAAAPANRQELDAKLDAILKGTGPAPVAKPQTKTSLGEDLQSAAKLAKLAVGVDVPQGTFACAAVTPATGKAPLKRDR